MAMMATAVTVPDLAAPPLKAHAVADSSDSGLSAQLRHALRDAAGQDPDLVKAIDDRRSLTVGGKHAKSFSAGQKSALAPVLSPDTERSASPEEHDRSYFALLHKISKLEAANARFEDQLKSLKEDAHTYEEVAHELEDDLNVVAAENMANLATIEELRARQVQAAATQARLVACEDTIAHLRLQLAEAGALAEPAAFTLPCDVSKEDCEVGLTYSRLRAHTQRAAVEYRRAVRAHLQTVSRERSQAVPRSSLPDLFSTPQDMLDDEVLSEDEGESDLCMRRKESLNNQSLSLRSVSCESAPEWRADAAAENANYNTTTYDFKETCEVGLTYCRVRAHTQRVAVEYRRAVRIHLQTASRESRQAAPRNTLSDLFSTPTDMLDDEVLSEDEGESDLCVRRKERWNNQSLSPRSVLWFEI